MNRKQFLSFGGALLASTALGSGVSGFDFADEYSMQPRYRGKCPKPGKPNNGKRKKVKAARKQNHRRKK